MVDPYLLSIITDCKYDPIIISDHAPVSIRVTLPTQRTERTWRLDTLLLADSDFVSFITEQIDFFLQVNRNEGISASTLWETLNAYLRGQIISCSAYIRKMKHENIEKLSSEIKVLYGLISGSPTSDLIKRRVGLQTKIDLLTTTQTETLIFKSRSRFYEEGDKPSKLLASQLRHKAASRIISQIRLPDSSSTQDHQAINNCFKEFYTKLYSSDSAPDRNLLDTFFSNLNIPTIDSDSKERLEQNLTLEEINNSIMSLQSGKAPGADGFPTDFYKKFKDKLAPLLLSVYEEALENNIFPPTLCQASITLLLKKNKDPLDCSSYRPISLTNCDGKVFSKAIALRLEAILPYIISGDQTGFIQGRQSYFNIRRLFNIIYTEPSTPSPEAVISLDAEKG